MSEPAGSWDICKICRWEPPFTADGCLCKRVSPRAVQFVQAIRRRLASGEILTQEMLGKTFDSISTTCSCNHLPEYDCVCWCHWRKG